MAQGHPGDATLRQVAVGPIASARSQRRFTRRSVHSPEGRTFPRVRNDWLDDEDAQFSDETTVDRRSEDAPAGGHQRELATVVEAVIGVDMGAAWIPPLLRQAAPSGPMKWPQVAAFIMHGSGEEARAARAGLSAQQIIVTDPMREARRMDLALAERGPLAEPACVALFAHGPTRQGPTLASVRTESLRDFLFNATLGQSGLGTLCDLFAQADRDALDGDIAGISNPSSAYLAPIAGSLNGSLNKAAKLASKTTALVSPLLDPDRRGTPRSSRGEDAAFSFPELAHIEARNALAVVADQRLVVDQGHQNITGLTQQLRDMAEVHAGEPFFEDRAAALETLRQQRREGASSRGYVRSDTDVRQRRLQLADVAAGWARTVIREDGYEALVTTFRCVIYNGRILTRGDAALLDRERRDYKRLLQQYPSLGTT